MSAVFFNYRSTVTVLLDNGAGENKTKLLKQIKNWRKLDPNIEEAFGWTALDWAIEYNYLRTAEILRAYGGIEGRTDYYDYYYWTGGLNTWYHHYVCVLYPT